MNSSPEITPELVRALLNYDPHTGALTWKARDSSTTKDHRRWNARYAGSLTGNLNSQGYLQIKLFKKRYQATRIAWMHYYGTEPKHVVDHIDGNIRNNAITNLQDITQAQNIRKSKRAPRTASGVTGVHLTPSGNYYARIGIACGNRSLGTFETLHEATQARHAAELDLWGDFAPHLQPFN